MMSKGATIAFNFTALLLVAMLFTACDKEDESSPGSDTVPMVVTHDGKLSGRLKLGMRYEDEASNRYKWIIGKNVSDEIDRIEEVFHQNMEIYELGESKVDNGHFSLTLKSPPAKYFKLVSDILGDRTGDVSKVKISDPEARMYDLFYPYAYKADDYRGSIHLVSLTDNLFYTDLVYVDRDVSVTGLQVFDSGFYSEITEYDIHYNKGWNVLVYFIIPPETANKSMIKLATTKDFDEIVWIYQENEFLN